MANRSGNSTASSPLDCGVAYTGTQMSVGDMCKFRLGPGRTRVACAA